MTSEARLCLAALALVAAGPPPAKAAASSREGAMLARPLFSPTRRPAPPPVPEEAPAEAPALVAPPPAVALSGVIAGEGAGVALLRRPQDAEPVRVVRGGQVDGWTLSEVRSRAVVLVRDGRSVTVELRSAGP